LKKSFFSQPRSWANKSKILSAGLPGAGHHKSYSHFVGGRNYFEFTYCRKYQKNVKNANDNLKEVLYAY